MLKVTVAVFALFSIASPALAQTAATASRIASASIEAARGVTPAGGNWACASSSSFEIAEVSSDVASDKTAYVLIHRVKGEPIASQRLTPAEVESFRRMGCDSDIATTEMASVIG